MSDATQVISDNNKSIIVFPSVVSTCTRIENGIEYNGIVATGGSDRINILGAIDIIDCRVVHVIVDTSMKMRLIVKYYECDDYDNELDNNISEQYIEKGKYQLDIYPSVKRKRERKRKGKGDILL
jgi:hypothetical protein